MHHEQLNKIIANAAQKAAEQKEKIILEQLNELISRGLLVVYETQPMLVQTLRDPLSPEPRVEIVSAIKLVLKDQEYIEKLEAENKDLKEKLNSIAAASHHLLTTIPNYGMV